jgi:hypothetical protein
MTEKDFFRFGPLHKGRKIRNFFWPDGKNLHIEIWESQEKQRKKCKVYFLTIIDQYFKVVNIPVW